MESVDNITNITKESRDGEGINVHARGEFPVVRYSIDHQDSITRERISFRLIERLPDLQHDQQCTASP